MTPQLAGAGHATRDLTRILLIHDRYQQRAGEQTVFEMELEMLSAAGHRPITYLRDNEEIRSYGLCSKVSLGLRTVWAWDSCRDLRALLGGARFGLAHFHNTFPLVSPAAYYACREARVPVVQTLHNYRLLCPAATFFRNGKVCEECVDHSLWRAIRYGCYHGSRPETAVVTAMLTLHRLGGTWVRLVDCYIALTEFARQKFIAAGLPAERIMVKPNFVQPDPGEKVGSGKYALFVGRLAPEKGLRTLLAAWEQLADKVPLLIVGDGPLRAELQVEAAERRLSSLSFVGRATRDRTLAGIKEARFLIFPSECNEGFPMTIAEAFACGTPVICSGMSTLREIVVDGCTGLHFVPGDAESLAQKVEWAWTHPEEMTAMGRAARAEYGAKYTAERNYEMLMEIYRQVLGARG